MLIPKSIFEVARCAATDPARFQLCGVRFERDIAGKATAVATDGKVLARVTWDEEPDHEYPVVDGGATNPCRKAGFGVTMPLSACKEAAKMVPKMPYKPILENVLLDELGTNGSIPMVASDLDSVRHLAPKAVDGTYPDWHLAFSSLGASKATIRFNPHRMIQACDTLLKTCGFTAKDGDPCAIMDLHGDNPIEITARREQIQTTILVMPLIVTK